MKLLIKNGRVIDPANDIDDFLEILVERGKIVGLAPRIAAEGAVVIDAEKKL